MAPEAKFQDLSTEQKVEFIMFERLPSPEEVVYAPTVEFLDSEGILTREERGKVVAMGDRTAKSYKSLAEQVISDRDRPAEQIDGETVDATGSFYLQYALAARTSNEISHSSVLEQMNAGPGIWGGDPPIIMEGISILSGLRDICSLRHFGFEAFSSRGGVFPENYWRVPPGLENSGIAKEINSVNADIYQTYLYLTRKGLEHYVKTVPRAEGEKLYRWRWKVLSMALDEARGVTNGTFLNHLSIHPNSALSLREGISALSSNDLPETQALAQKLRELAGAGLPTLMRHTEASPYMASLGEKRRTIIEKFDLNKEEARRGKEGKSELLSIHVSPGRADRFFLASLLSEGADVDTKVFDKVLGFSDEDVSWALGEIFEGFTLHDKPPKALENIQIHTDVVWPLGAVYEAIRHRLVTHTLSELTINRGFIVPELYKELGLVEDYTRAIRMNERMYTLVEKLGPRFEAFRPYFVSRNHLVRQGMRISGYDSFHFFKLRASSGAHPTISGPAYGMLNELQNIYSPIFKNVIVKK